MADSHPNNLDPRPKRRRDEENPYEIYTAGINTAHPHFYLFFKDCDGVKRWMEIDKTLFDAFDEFELDDLSFFNEVDRHYEKSEVTEATLNRRAAKPQESVEETVSQRMEVDKLHQAIAQLPEKQRRRLVLYYFGEFTYEQIAAMEKCKFQVIAKSVKAAEKNLKNYLTGGEFSRLSEETGGGRWKAFHLFLVCAANGFDL